MKPGGTGPRRMVIFNRFTLPGNTAYHVYVTQLPCSVKNLDTDTGTTRLILLKLCLHMFEQSFEYKTMYS